MSIVQHLLDQLVPLYLLRMQLVFFKHCIHENSRHSHDSCDSHDSRDSRDSGIYRDSRDSGDSGDSDIIGMNAAFW